MHSESYVVKEFKNISIIGNESKQRYLLGMLRYDEIYQMTI